MAMQIRSCEDKLKRENSSLPVAVLVSKTRVLKLTTDGDDDDDGVAQHGGHTPNNRLTDMQLWLTALTPLISDIHVMINWHLSKQGIY